MKNAFVFTFLLSLSCVAQNSDFGFLAGVSGPKAEVTIGSSRHVSALVGASLQLNYAWQFRTTKSGDLYTEMPIVFLANAFGGNVGAATTAATLVTPGIRLKVPVHGRLSLYGAAGAGIGWMYENAVLAGPQSNGARVGYRATWVVDFGGGVDFRLSRLISLRAEARDYMTRKGLSGIQGMNHLIIQGGVGFHF